jgi:hypothetical protein
LTRDEDDPEDEGSSLLKWSTTHWIMLVCAVIGLLGTLLGAYLALPNRSNGEKPGETKDTTVASARLIYKADFSSRSDGPFKVPGGNALARTNFDVVDGEYRIRIEAAPRNQIVLAQGRDEQAKGTLIIEFDVRADGHIDDLLYGLNLSPAPSTGRPGNVSLGISSRGTYDLAIDGRSMNSQQKAAIKTGGAPNHLKVEVSGREATLYVNNELMGTMTHELLAAPPLNVGFFLVNSSAQNYASNAVTNVYFDNLRVLDRR